MAVLPKSPMGDSKISALPSQSRAQQRHHTCLALRKLPCLRGNGGKEDPPQGDPELQWVFKSLWKSAFLIAEDMVCHKHADSTRSINFDCNRKIRQVKWKWKGKKIVKFSFSSFLVVCFMMHRLLWSFTKNLHFIHKAFRHGWKYYGNCFPLPLSFIFYKEVLTMTLAFERQFFLLKA